MQQSVYHAPQSWAYEIFQYLDIVNIASTISIGLLTNHAIGNDEDDRDNSQRAWSICYDFVWHLADVRQVLVVEVWVVEMIYLRRHGQVRLGQKSGGSL